MTFRSLKKLPAIFMILGVISCTKQPCKCDFNAVNFISVKLVDQQGKNLIFGNNALYRLDSLQLLEKKNNFDVFNGSVQRSLIDSNTIEISFYYMNITRGYLHYNMQTAEDSIEIRWVKKTGKCCESPIEYQVIDSVKFNAVPVSPVNGLFTFVK